MGRWRNPALHNALASIRKRWMRITSDLEVCCVDFDLFASYGLDLPESGANDSPDAASRGQGTSLQYRREKVMKVDRNLPEMQTKYN
jgi:hypothetical protein